MHDVQLSHFQIIHFLLFSVNVSKPDYTANGLHCLRVGQGFALARPRKRVSNRNEQTQISLILHAYLAFFLEIISIKLQLQMNFVVDSTFLGYPNADYNLYRLCIDACPKEAPYFHISLVLADACQKRLPISKYLLAWLFAGEMVGIKLNCKWICRDLALCWADSAALKCMGKKLFL
jgi:hypothetical protein